MMLATSTERRDARADARNQMRDVESTSHPARIAAKRPMPDEHHRVDAIEDAAVARDDPARVLHARERFRSDSPRSPACPNAPAIDGERDAVHERQRRQKPEVREHRAERTADEAADRARPRLLRRHRRVELGPFEEAAAK